MRYYCVTHKPLEWSLPEFVQAVSAAPVDDERVRPLGHHEPSLAARGHQLGEYAALFALRRELQQAELSAELVGISHYRRFPVTRAVGERHDEYNILSPEEFAELSGSILLPGPGQLVVPSPIDLGKSVLENYAAAHHVEDLLRFFAIAVEQGIVPSFLAATFLAQRYFVPAASVGVYPADWLIETLTRLEAVCNQFLEELPSERVGYQARVASFCSERLHGLLLLQFVGRLPPQSVVYERSVIISSTGVYAPGA